MSLAGPPRSSNTVPSNSENNERVVNYLEDLSRKRNILAQIACEEPQTPPRSPLQEGSDLHEGRINAIRERVQDAWTKAEGNPADGKWFFLSRLLRMGVTSGQGGRWLGARMDVQPVVELSGNNSHWINADTESEWQEWELKEQEERILRDKVESWKRKLESHQTASSVVSPASGKAPGSSSAIISNRPDPSAVSQSKQSAKISKAKSNDQGAAASIACEPNPAIKVASSSVDPFKDNSPFGFSVVKRASQKTPAGKPAKYINHKSSNKRPEPERENPFLASHPGGPVSSGSKPDDPPQPIDILQIADFTASSFIAPSFSSSAIITSTPKAHTTAKPSTARKPNSIRHLEQAESLAGPFLLPFVKSPGNPSTSSSLANAREPLTNVQGASSFFLPPSAPTSPTRNPNHPFPSKLTPDALSSDANVPSREHYSTNSNSNNKRPRLARSASPTAMHGDGNERALKKARTLPASSIDPPNRRSKDAAFGTGVPLLIHAAEGIEGFLSSSPTSPPVTPQRHKVPTLTELLASAKKSKGMSSSSHRALDKRKLITLSQDYNTVDKQMKSKSPLLSSPPRRLPSAAPVIDPYADDADFDAIIAANAAPPSPPNDPYFDPYCDLPVDGDVSPTKSLSSLAGSDSEEDEDDDEARAYNFPPAKTVFGGKLKPDFVFQPPVTSTQHGPFEDNTERQDSWASVYGPATNSNNNNNTDLASRPPPSSGSLYPAYNSQFEADVARKVDTVSQFLDKDMDYASWLRDPSPPPQPGMGVEDSP